MNDNDNTLDISVAPNTQHINEQDSLGKTKPSELFGCFDPGTNKQHSQYDLFNDMGILPTNNDEEQLLQNRLHESEYRRLVRSLNIKQKEFFYHVLHSVKTKDDPLRLFLSGGAGVGKTTVTNALYEALTRYLNNVPGENPDEVKLVKVAPTGTAAFNIKGNTLHSAFKIPANRGFQYCTLDTDRLNTIRAQLRKLKVIFIDEISMVGNGMFNFLNLRLQQIMGNNTLFGGISMITVGDLFQLKPVFDDWIFENTKDSYGALATNIWKENFTLSELTQIMRQKDDKQFAELLNRLREGNHTTNDIQVLKQRILKLKYSEENYPIKSTHLFPENEDVDKHNNRIYQASNTQKVQIESIDIIVGDITDDLKQKLKEKIPNNPSKTMGLFNVGPVTIGAKYDLTTNINVIDGMPNGADCVVQKVDYRVINSTRPSIIWVSFQDSDIGHNQRNEFAHLFTDNIDKTWTPILEITRQFKISKKHQYQILRRQYPLRPATAKTIHRSQGHTLNEAVVDLPSSKRQHMHYVALSRVKNSSALHIINLNENKICVNENVREEMSRLRKQSLVPSLQFLYNANHCVRLKVLFHNVRSLHLHFDDVVSDYNVQASNINIFAETRLCSADHHTSYEMADFTLFRNDFNTSTSVRSSYGIAVYIKSNIHCATTPFSSNFNNIEITVSVLNDPLPNLHVIGIYRSKNKASHQKLIETMNYLLDTLIPNTETPALILGDLNVNLMEVSSEQKTLTCLIQKRNFTQLLNQFTTDYRTQIDHIYTNMPNHVLTAGALESYYSDHKPIFVCLV